MRKKIVAGNWKMNLVHSEAMALISELKNNYSRIDGVDLVIGPPVIYLSEISAALANSNIKLASQNSHFEEKGPYTGEISAKMLSHINVDYGIIGHSERRQYYNESDTSIFDKFRALQKENIIPVLCIGESQKQRESGDFLTIIEGQLECLLKSPSAGEKPFVIAYEPVWAIGTGLTASPEQAQEVHHYIRQLLSTRISDSVAKNIPILYGGSCKPSNAKELFGCEDIDGGLIGGASLKAEDFLQIAKSI